MEVILLQKVFNLGEIGCLVKVKPGYARNYLIPQNKALPATRRNRLEFEKKREVFEKAQEALIQSAQSRIETLRTMDTLKIESKVGAEGKLFGAITAKDVVDLLISKGFSVKKQELKLPEKYLKQVGIYTLSFHPLEVKESNLTCVFDLHVQGEISQSKTL